MYENFLKNECNIDVDQLVGNSGDPALESNTPVATDNTLDSVDVAILGATGFSQELMSFIQRADNLSAGIEQLSDIQDVTTAAASDGGLTKREGQLIAQQVSGLCGLLNVPEVDIPAMEHFGDTSPRSVATDMVATEAADTVKKWINSLMEFIKKQFDALSKLWEKYTDAGQRLKTWAEKKLPLIDKLGALKEGKDKIKYPTRLADKDGKVLDGKGVESGMKELVTFLEKDVPAVVSFLDKAAIVPSGGEGIVMATYGKFLKAAKAVSLSGKLPNTAAAELSGKEIKSSAVQMGNFALVVAYPATPGSTDEELRASTKKVVVKSIELKVKEPSKDGLQSTPLDVGMMKSVATEIQSVADAVTQIKKDVAKSKSEIEKSSKNLIGRDETTVKFMAPYLQKVAGFYASGPAMAIQKAVVTLRAAAEVIDTSISAHEKSA